MYKWIGAQLMGPTMPYRGSVFGESLSLIPASSLVLSNEWTVEGPWITKQLRKVPHPIVWGENGDGLLKCARHVGDAPSKW